MGRFTINPDTKVNGMRQVKSVSDLTKTLQKEAFDFFRKDYFVKGAYTLQLILGETGEPRRDTVDVDFFSTKLDKPKALKQVEEFAEQIQKYGNILYKEVYTEEFDNQLTVFFYEDVTVVLALDFREGPVDESY